MWRYIPLLMSLVVSLSGEYLVEVKNVPASAVHQMELTGKVDVVNYQNGTLQAITYDGGKTIEQMGFSYRVLRDLEVDRAHWMSIKGKDGWHSYAQYLTHFDSLATAYPNIAKLDTIGFTSDASHWPILCLKVSDNPQEQEFEPEIRYVGVHHGNEQVSGEVLYRYATYLLENYGTDPDVTWLVNNREIYIIPVLNPYGYEHDTRRNENSVDLNRDYGYMWDGSGSSSEPYSQPETQYIYEHSQLHNFTVSLTYHSGAFYVNYPWNYTPVRLPDTPFLYDISAAYADSTGYPLTEGYEWYQTRGDLNDYSYGIDSDLDVTIELYNPYDPPATMLDSVFNLNRGAMNMWALKGGQGIGGFVIDSVTGDTIKEARIYVEGIDWPVYTDRVIGDYIKVLQPGTYTLKVEANGYETKYVPDIQVTEDSLTHVDVYLTPTNSNTYAFKPVEVVVNASNYSRIPVDTFLVGNMLGAPDGRFYYLGVGGHVVLDMGEHTPAVGQVIVHEGDDGVPDEGFNLYGSNNWHGPWSFIGQGNGTATFNLATPYRYLKVVDDGDGSESAPNCGYDLDAIEVFRVEGPYPVVSGYEIIDTLGNNDGRMDPGENVDFITEITNIGNQDASTVTVELSTTSDYLTIDNPVATISGLAVNDTAAVGFGIAVSENAPRGTEADIVVTVTDSASGNSSSSTISVTIGALTASDPTGPDNYGYIAYDSDDEAYPEWPQYDWVDASSGTQLNLGDDDIATVNLPFQFTYYGQAYNTISVCSNGFIAMGASSSSPYGNEQLPNSDGIVMVAPFWDDLNPSSGGNVYTLNDAENHRFIVEWNGVPHFGSTTTETFEVIFYDPAYYPTMTGDGVILFQYQSVGDATSCTIGIESPSENDALALSYNGSHPVTFEGPRNNYAVKFTTGATRISEGEDRTGLRPYFGLRNNVVNGAGTLYFSLPHPGSVSLAVFDVSGRMVKELYSGRAEAGNHTLAFQLPKSGIYFVRYSVNGKEIGVQKLVSLK